MNDSGMRVRIHRGATEIGGNCVEVHAAGATLLLDLGRPLTAARDEVVPLPPAIGLGEPGPPPLAVILSHGHADHWGLVPSLPPGIPVTTRAIGAAFLGDVDWVRLRTQSVRLVNTYAER